jgi:hypothetical protein
MIGVRKWHITGPGYGCRGRIRLGKNAKGMLLTRQMDRRDEFMIRMGFTSKCGVLPEDVHTGKWIVFEQTRVKGSDYGI